MIIITLDDNRELAVYKGFEIIAPRGEAIGELLKIISASA